MPKTTIVIPTLGLQSYLQLCVASVFMHTPEQDYDIIIVDNFDPEAKGVMSPLNFSDFGNALQYFQNVRGTQVHFVSTGENYGFAKSCNEGAVKAREGGSEFVVFLNNDCVVHPGWLDVMIKTWHNHKKTGLVGVWSNFAGGIQSVFSRQAQLLKPHYGIKCIKGLCILVSTERFWQVGGFDEAYSKTGSFTDDDLSMKMIDCGYYNVIAPIFITHFGSRTFEAMGVDLRTDPEILADQRRFHKKWDEKFKPIQVKEKE